MRLRLCNNSRSISNTNEKAAVVHCRARGSTCYLHKLFYSYSLFRMCCNILRKNTLQCSFLTRVDDIIAGFLLAKYMIMEKRILRMLIITVNFYTLFYLYSTLNICFLSEPIPTCAWNMKKYKYFVERRRFCASQLLPFLSLLPTGRRVASISLLLLLLCEGYSYTYFHIFPRKLTTQLEYHSGELWLRVLVCLFRGPMANRAIS